MVSQYIKVPQEDYIIRDTIIYHGGTFQIIILIIIISIDHFSKFSTNKSIIVIKILIKCSRQFRKEQRLYHYVFTYNNRYQKDIDQFGPKDTNMVVQTFTMIDYQKWYGLYIKHSMDGHLNSNLLFH